MNLLTLLIIINYLFTAARLWVTDTSDSTSLYFYIFWSILVYLWVALAVAWRLSSLCYPISFAAHSALYLWQPGGGVVRAGLWLGRHLIRKERTSLQTEE